MANWLPRKKLLKFNSKILNVKNITSDTKNITISIPKEFDFYPGQFVSLLLTINGREVRRPYSIASTPKKGELDLCIKILPKGYATPIIDKLEMGDEVKVMGPMGTFYIFEQSRKKSILFISTGTGVAPFRSIINNLLQSNHYEEVILITGYRYKENILYEKEFKDLEEKYKNFSYHRICSREGENKGYVQKLIDQNFNNEADYYICGLKDMVNSVKEYLEKKDVPKENIFFEKYD